VYIYHSYRGVGWKLCVSAVRRGRFLIRNEKDSYEAREEFFVLKTFDVSGRMDKIT
jgi:hypothetical protein